MQLTPTRSAIFIALLATTMFATGCRGTLATSDPQLTNFHAVNDTLYRGGQPTPEGFDRLHELGIKTVINLRHREDEKPHVYAAHLQYGNRPIFVWRASDEDVLWFLSTVTNPALQPVFVHCKHGADRSGYLIAMYRIVVEGWTRDEAIDEMKSRGFHPVYAHLIRYVRHADIEDLRTALRERRIATADERG